MGGYKKLEDGFVDTFLAKEVETVEEAKHRIRNGSISYDIAPAQSPGHSFVKRPPYIY
ncbi:hypothetical protein [Ruminococcus sp.]|uniref:hypothetical protein n=1 Tax=Ruminococcus sp. TaxID=41978 RepID=UPI0025DDF77F|nr:hypothetical protein [Ruminococcus sp.]MBQ8966388.1 hypothetical protein [Ruminococcus sp.]